MIDTSYFIHFTLFILLYSYRCHCTASAQVSQYLCGGIQNKCFSHSLRRAKYSSSHPASWELRSLKNITVSNLGVGHSPSQNRKIWIAISQQRNYSFRIWSLILSKYFPFPLSLEVGLDNNLLWTNHKKNLMHQFHWIPHIYYQTFSAAKGQLVIKADGLMLD